ncbi:MAG: zinc-dependent metalloprotease, partial [Eudoraea sp.]|nr:zinc-dependent metalloprotease [Eudoraea sp.]
MRLALTVTCLVVLMSSCTALNLSRGGGKNLQHTSTEPAKTKPIDRLIGKDAITKNGLFKVHKDNENYYFEIADSLLNREILVVTRFIKTPAGAGNYGGEEIGDKTIIFEKGPLNKIFLRIATFVSTANENDDIAQAVNNSSVTPILEAFDIKARNEEANSSVIDVTKFINSENPLLALSNRQKDAYKLSGLEKDKSYIKNINSFPINTEIRTVKTYKAKASSTKSKKSLPAAALSGFVTLELNNSFILLPKEPMKKRFYDPRVGFFASSYLEYGDDQQQVEENIYIHRWRLEPKPEDYEKWKRGELVTPAKPIVFYLDPATPKKWRPFLIQGINDWQEAFEQAGFKNAIVGKEWPENDENMSLEDARFSVLRYFASPAKNAYGPNITDPRSGEILESHIGWYHNLMTLLHNWYMIQAGAVDARAQKMQFDTELMGQLVRFVCAHEVGHTLGLRHNMAASYATSVDHLRDAEWLRKHGHTSSIMDYARFNYVAQPEDSIPPADLMPRIGDYDKWAIQWGYSGLPQEFTSGEEKEYLNTMVIDSISNNQRLWFGGEGRDFDPRSQREDLGDNSVLASNYGIMNLQRIVPYLTEWTKEKGSDDYSNLDQVYKDLVKQYDNYLFHVVKNIGGIYVTPKT